MRTWLKKLLPANARKSIETRRQVGRIDFDSDEIALPKEVFRKDSFLRISFCTTCMNRAHHLKHTLRKNIADNSSYPNLEFVILNYNSSDDMDAWFRRAMKKEMKSGLVRYARTPDPQHYNSSHSKNLAHAIATGDVLVNVDADNFAGKDFAFFLNHAFQEANGPVLLRVMRSLSCAGRIAVRREDFFKVAGYDEKLTERHFGYDDYDFVGRLEASGIRCINVDTPNFTRYIWHSDEERAENYAQSDARIEMTSHDNYQLSRENIEKGRLRGNDGDWAVAKIYQNLDDDPVMQRVDSRV